MLQADHDYWSKRVADTLARLNPGPLRKLAARLDRPSDRAKEEDLIDRCVAALNNVAVIDRRLGELDVGERRLLALIGSSRKPVWQFDNLIGMLAALGHTEGYAIVENLMDAGLLYPALSAFGQRAASWRAWLAQTRFQRSALFAHPAVTARLLNENLGLPCLSPSTPPVTVIDESDGLDWLFWLAAFWQVAKSSPFRQTKEGDLHKRDWNRLYATVTSLGIDSRDLPDALGLALLLALAANVLGATDSEVVARKLPLDWDDHVVDALVGVWTALLGIVSWNVSYGATGRDYHANPFSEVYLLFLLLLRQAAKDAWISDAELGKWIVSHHPYWCHESQWRDSRRQNELEKGLAQAANSFLVGIAAPMRLVQLGNSSNGELVARLSPLGRWMVGSGKKPPAPESFPKTILVQPNLEIVAFRQGLTPARIRDLSLIADWSTVGSACTLRLKEETVHRALESGWDVEQILRLLEQLSTTPVPPAVTQALRTWAGKRDRLQVYTSAALLEFASAEDLEAAQARGLQGVRITDRLLVVPNESQIGLDMFRFIATRDYRSPPDRCVTVADDGVTLTIDQTRSDLLFESEISRFAEPVNSPAPNTLQYRLTPQSAAASRTKGVTYRILEEWFLRRTGESAPPAAYLLFAGLKDEQCEFRTQLILQVDSKSVADGLMQWPPTRDLIAQRLGPTTFAVERNALKPLQEHLRSLSQ